jgi:osmotically-inducible protein OsmY
MRDHTLAYALAAALAACGTADGDEDLPAPSITHARSNEAIVAHAENDIVITSAVRASVVQDHDLSMEAKNIKILSSAGVVTLRGSVATQVEKARVVEIAEATSGVAQVEEHLSVIEPVD